MTRLNPGATLLPSWIRFIAFRATFTCRILRLLVLTLAALSVASPASADIVVLKDGTKLKGRVINLGGNAIELKIREGASRRLLLKEIDKATFDLAADSPRLLQDRVVLKNGTSVLGTATISEDGKSVVVSHPDGSQVSFPREDVRIIPRDEVGKEGGGVYSAAVQEAVKSAIGEVLAGGKGSAPAEERLKAEGIFAIDAVREALKKAKPGSPAADALDRVVRLYRLKETTHDSLQEISDYYRILAPLCPGTDLDQAVDQKRQILAEMFTNYLNQSVPVAKLLVLDAREDPRVRAAAVALLGQNGFNRELIDIYNHTAGGQVQLAAGMALARNRMLAGAEVLIQALELNTPEVREIAFKALKEASGKDFGFGVHDTPSARNASIARWKAWWDQNRDAIQAQTADLLSGRDRPEDTAERKKAIELWQEGCLDMDKKNFDAAEAKMRAAMRADPTFPSPQVSLATLLFSHPERVDEGRKLLDELLERKVPDLGSREVTWIRYYLGRAHELSGHLDRADLEYQAALNLDPKFYRAALAQAGVKFHQATQSGDGGAARAAGQVAGKAAAKDLTPAARRSLIEEALRLYHHGIELIDEYSNGLEILSMNDLAPETPPAFERQDYNRGIVDLKTSLRLAKSEAFFSQAKIRALLDDRPRAIKELTSAIETLGSDRKGGSRELLVQVHNYRGYLHEEEGQPAEALKDYQAVVQSGLDPRNQTAQEGIRRLSPRKPSGAARGGGGPRESASAARAPSRRAPAPEER
jgi:tetratricopeptide (TPR) repeat protein